MSTSTNQTDEISSTKTEKLAEEIEKILLEQDVLNSEIRKNGEKLSEEKEKFGQMMANTSQIKLELKNGNGQFLAEIQKIEKEIEEILVKMEDPLNCEISDKSDKKREMIREMKRLEETQTDREELEMERKRKRELKEECLRLQSILSTVPPQFRLQKTRFSNHQLRVLLSDNQCELEKKEREIQNLHSKLDKIDEKRKILRQKSEIMAEKSQIDEKRIAEMSDWIVAKTRECPLVETQRKREQETIDLRNTVDTVTRRNTVEMKRLERRLKEETQRFERRNERITVLEEEIKEMKRPDFEEILKENVAELTRKQCDLMDEIAQFD